jgi:hypothetical protein
MRTQKLRKHRKESQNLEQRNSKFIVQTEPQTHTNVHYKNPMPVLSAAGVQNSTLYRNKIIHTCIHTYPLAKRDVGDTLGIASFRIHPKWVVFIISTDCSYDHQRNVANIP